LFGVDYSKITMKWNARIKTLQNEEFYPGHNRKEWWNGRSPPWNGVERMASEKPHQLPTT